MSTTVDNENKPRQQMSKIVGLSMSVARIRRWIDSQGLNYNVQREIDECNQELTTLKRKGGPEDPGSMPVVAKDASDVDKKTYETALNEWKKNSELFKDFKSKEYRTVERVHECYKLLNKLQERLGKTTQSDRVQKEVEALQDQLSDKPKPQDPKETDDVYNRRVKTFKSPGYVRVRGEKLDLNDADAINSRMTQLSEKFPDLDYFLRKDSLSNQKVRFNDDGVISIATIAENMTRELAINAIRNAASQSKKIIKPDHIIASGEYSESPYYNLIDDLSHLNALVDRAQRRVKHKNETAEKRQEMYRKVRTALARQNKPYTSEDRPDVDSLPTFEDTEVENGYAIRTTSETVSKGKPEPRSIYLWKGIDYDDDVEDDDNVNFEHYVEKLCKSIKSTEEIQSSDGAFADGIKVSKDIKKFLSDNVIDWLTRFAPKLRILINYNGVKTIDGNTVLAALKIMLSKSYLNRDGQINWNSDHQALFDDINHRLSLWHDHNSSNAGKTSDVDESS